MRNLTFDETTAMLLKLGKNRILFIEDIGYEGNGFDIVLPEDKPSYDDTTIRYVCFEEYENQKAIIDDLKYFIDSAR